MPNRIICRFLLAGLLMLGMMAAVCPVFADAQFVKRFVVNDHGAVTFTGNTLGLSKMTSSAINAYSQPWYSRPGVVTNNPVTGATNSTDDIGAFINSLNSGSATSAWFANTTLNWQNDASDAQLHVTGKVLYAELIWAGSTKYGTQSQGDPANATDITAYIDTPVKFTTPAGGPYSITPDSKTSCSVPPPAGDGQQFYYVRSANVTSYVQAAGAGTYTVGGVPATITWSDDSHNCAGWTLAVVYEDATKPMRNMSIFVGGQLVSPNSGPMSPVAISGFNTPSTGTVTARLAVSALEGDPYKTGDQMKFGATQGALTAISGSNNPSNNFFCSAINGDTGSLDTSGSFGSKNADSSKSTYMVSGARQGWDITNVDVSGTMTNSQSTAWMQGTTSNDGYVIHSLGLQIDIAAPKFPQTALSVNKATTYVGDTLTYTVTLDNTAGTVDAQTINFTNNFPNGVTFVPGSFTAGGVTKAGADPTVGVALGTVAKGTSLVVTFQGRVNAIPVAPDSAVYNDSAAWTYTYRSDTYLPIQNAGSTTNTVTTSIPRLVCAKSCSTTNQIQYQQTVTYTVTANNTGTADSGGSTLTDPIPAGVAYVPGSTTLNGATVSDVGGQMPFAAGALIKSPSGTSGQVKIGETATITFKVSGNQTPPLAQVTNLATIDVDGSGPAPGMVAGVTNPAKYADLGVTITDNQTVAVAGLPVTYLVQVVNNGPDTVTGVTLPVKLPAVLLSPIFTSGSGAYTSATGAWTGLNLSSGQQVTLRITGTVAPIATGTMIASASVSPPVAISDLVSTNNSASDTDTIQRQVNLSITNTDNQTYAAPGSAITYTIIVTNSGPSSLDTVTITNTYDSGKLVMPAQPADPFSPSQGAFNKDNGLWNGLSLGPGQSVTLTFTSTVSSSATGTLRDTATVAPPSDVTELDSSDNTAADLDIIGLPGSGVSGTVFADANHDGLLNFNEGSTGVAGLYIKLVPAAGGSALQAGAVDVVSGSYALPNVAAGNYTLVISQNSTLSDTTPQGPNGWISTQPTTLTRAITVTSGYALPGQNFGFWQGSNVSGLVFNDNGAGGGTPNDGVKNGGEVGLTGVMVRATDAAGATTYDSASTAYDGSYTLWLPSTAGTVKVVETNPGGSVSVSGKAGTTGGSYDRTADATSFTTTSGVKYANVTFGDVACNTFTNDNQRITSPGGTVCYAHTFIAGTGGQVTFTTTHAASPLSSYWTNLIYLDAGGSGVIAPGDNVVSGPISVVAGQQVNLLVKAFVPPNAPEGAQDQITIQAAFTYSNASPALSSTYTHTDLTMVADQAGLALVKNVDKATAKSGDVITYTIRYQNISSDPLHNLCVYDDTPAFTTFITASFGVLPAELTGCAVTAPAAGDRGSLAWTFSGSLDPGSSGTVSYQVRVQ